MYGCATEKTDLAFCTSYEDETSADETSADGEHIRARKYSSEGLPNDMCEISAVTKFTANKKPLLDLQRLQHNRPSAVQLQSWLYSIGRTCLSAGTCLIFQPLCSWRYKSEYSRIYDVPVPRITGKIHQARWLRFCILGKAWERGYMCIVWLYYRGNNRD